MAPSTFRERNFSKGCEKTLDWFSLQVKTAFTTLLPGGCG